MYYFSYNYIRFYIYVLDRILNKVSFSQSFLYIRRTCLALIIRWNEHICQKYIVFKHRSTYAVFKLERKPSERINRVTRGLTNFIQKPVVVQLVKKLWDFSFWRRRVQTSVIQSREHAPLKRRSTSILHGTISHKFTIFIVKTLLQFVEPQSSLPYSQQPIAGCYPEAGLSTTPPDCYRKIRLNIIAPSAMNC
jgi:hypothetical protein